jgi:hypothetical protein
LSENLNERRRFLKMAVIFPCPGDCPIQDRFCGEAVIESELCFVPSILNPVSIEVTVQNATVEFVCCNMVVVCGTLRKELVFGPGTTSTVRLVPFQVHVPIDCNEVSVPLTADNLIVNAAALCGGCFRALCPVTDRFGTITGYHKIKEKDVFLFEFLYTPAP